MPGSHTHRRVTDKQEFVNTPPACIILQEKQLERFQSGNFRPLSLYRAFSSASERILPSG